MSSSRRVVVYTPDNTEITYMTGAQWDTAGIVKRADGTWHLAAHGFSANSVRSRTLAYYNRTHGLTEFAVASIYDATAPCVRKYFETHKVVIEGYFIPGSEDVHGLRMSASRTNVRKLLQQGATQIGFQLIGTNRVADFQASELSDSLKSRKAN